MNYFKKFVTIAASITIALVMSIMPVSALAYDLQSYTVPEGNTSFKTYMNYGAITNKDSAQYKLQQKAYTNEDGLRMIDDYYLIAIGSYYSNTIGDKFLIYLDTGKKFKAIVGDFKADEHTDETNRYRNVYTMEGTFISKNVIEFIVDTSTLDKTAKNAGDISAIEGFKGNISAVYKMNEKSYEKE